MPRELRQEIEQPNPGRLTEEERAYLIRLARDSMVAAVTGMEGPATLRREGGLGVKRAAFVTLRNRFDGSLRGCRGECPARRPLVDSVLCMSASSALDDPRFDPVSPSEIDDISIEISALSGIGPIKPEDIELGKHGLLIVSGWNSGLLLPQVATTFRWTREQFLRGLCKKAGLDEMAWQDEPVELYGFETETWAEREGQP